MFNETLFLVSENKDIKYFIVCKCVVNALCAFNCNVKYNKTFLIFFIFVSIYLWKSRCPEMFLKDYNHYERKFFRKLLLYFLLHF